MLCRTMKIFYLLEQFELADDGQLFCFAVCCVDDTDNGEHKEHQGYQADDTGDKIESPGDRQNDNVQDPVRNTPCHAGKEED